MAVNKARSGGFIASELERINEQYSRDPYSQRRQRERLNEAQQIINGEQPLKFYEDQLTTLQATLKFAVSDDDKRAVKNSILETQGTINMLQTEEKAVSRLTPRLQMYEESTRERLNSQAVNAVNREFSDRSIHSYAGSLSNTQSFQTAGLGLASQYSFEELAKRRTELMSRVGTLRAGSATVAAGYIGPNGPDPTAQDKLSSNEAAMQSLGTQLAHINVAMKHQRGLGVDPESRMADAASMAQKAEKLLDFNKLKDDISAGRGEYGNMSARDLKKKEEEAAQGLIKALEALSKAAGETPEKLEELNKKVEEASEKLQEVQEAGAAGAGGRNTFGTIGAYASAVGQAAALVGRGITALGVDMPMQNMSNIGGLANLENQKHDSWQSAIAGNMTERLTLRAWTDAEKFGGNRAFWANKAMWANTIAGAAATTAGAAQTAEAVKNAPGAQTAGSLLGNSDTVGKLAQGALATGEGINLTLTSGANVYDRTFETQARIAGTAITMDTARKLMHIQGYQMQQYRNHAMNFYKASTGLGRRQDAFLEETTGADYLDRMKEYGLGTEQAGSLAHFGVQNMGSRFDSGQILMAKRFENLGLGSAEENMGRMASLGRSGTQNPSVSLEKLLERAVSVGLDSSKAISMIADSTGTMAEGSAARGIANTGDAVSSHLLTAIDPMNKNQELAVQAAVGAYQTNEGSRNDRSATWHGMIATSRLMKDIGTNWESAQALQGLSITELRTMQGMDAGQLNTALWKRGISGDSFKGGAQNALKQTITDKLISGSEANGGFANGASRGFIGTILPWLNQDGANADVLKTALGPGGDMRTLPANVAAAAQKQNWVYQNMGNPQALWDDQLAAFTGGRDTKGLGMGDIAGREGVSGALGAEFNRAGYVQSRTAAYAARTLDPSGRGGGAAQALSATGDAAMATFGPSPEEAWSAAAADTAKSFGETAMKLNSSADKLSEAAEQLLIASRVRNLSHANVSMPSALDADKSSLGMSN